MAADAWNPTTLGFALLQVLSRGHASGYDLKKFFYESIGRHWHAYDTQIYRELKKLEEHGYAVGQDAKGAAGPPRRLYSITPKGVQATVDWLQSPIETGKIKDELGLRLWTARLFPPGQLAELLREALSQWTVAREHMFWGLRNLPSVGQGPYQSLDRRLAIDYAIAIVEAKIQWAERTIRQIELAEAAGRDPDTVL